MSDDIEALAALKEPTSDGTGQTPATADRDSMLLSDLLSLVRHALVLLVSFGVLRLTDDQILHIGAIVALVVGAVWYSGKDRRRWWKVTPPPPKTRKPPKE